MQKNENNYCYSLRPPKTPTVLQIGDIVWVSKGEKLFSRAIVVENLIVDCSSKFVGRQKVEYEKDRSTYHCKPNRLIKVV
jgi:hypothetical protein